MTSDHETLGEMLQNAIAAWHGVPPTSASRSEADPLAITLESFPTYLPLLQPKNGYSAFGKHTTNMRVLGLSRQATWILDGRGSGRISRDYGAGEQAFGAVPVPLGLLQHALLPYPGVAKGLQAQRLVAQAEARFIVNARHLRSLVEQGSRASSEDYRLRGSLHSTYAALGRLETLASIDVLTQTLASVSALMREAALYGLSQMTTIGAVSAVKRRTQGQGQFEEWEERVGAQVHDSAYLARIAALLHDNAIVVRRMAVAAIKAVGTAAAQELLIQFVVASSDHSERQGVIADAIDALVALDAPSAAAPLHTLLQASALGAKDDAVATVMTATLALQTFWQPTDMDLVRVLLRHPASSVRAAAAYVAMSQRLVALRDDLLASFEHDEAPEVRVEAGYALVAFGDRRIIPILQRRGWSVPAPYTNPFDQMPRFESTEAREMLQMLESEPSS